MKNNLASKNISFVLISLLFIAYLIVFGLVADKLASIWPSTLELIDYCQQAIENWSSVYTTPNGIIQLAALAVLAAIAGRFVIASAKTVIRVWRTRKFIRSLAVEQVVQGAHIIHSSKLEAFTAGFISPQIYISSTLVSKLTAQELQAVILHEQAHQQAFDPLKQLVIDFIAMTLPLPGKQVIFKHYQLLTELAADQQAITHTKSRKVVISALFKLINEHQPQLALGYNTTSDRIAILVDQKPVYSTKLFASMTTILMLMFLFSGSLVSTTISLPVATATNCKQPWQINFSSNTQSFAR